jgi:uncharacterized damage-inducible protein DinB
MISGRVALEMPPAPDSYAPFYAGYVARVPSGNIIDVMDEHFARHLAALRGIPSDKEQYRYAPEKWSVRECVGHMCDTERVFSYRLLRIARADETPLPGFDENLFAQTAGHDAVPLTELLHEYSVVHQATLALVRHLPAAAWDRLGNASGKPVSVRALAHITVGHELHHMAIFRERYGLAV